MNKIQKHKILLLDFVYDSIPKSNSKNKEILEFQLQKAFQKQLQNEISSNSKFSQLQNHLQKTRKWKFSG